MRTEPVHALSRDEAVLLARELPHLGALITGTPLDGGGGPGRPAGRELAVRVLAAAQGHPSCWSWPMARPLTRPGWSSCWAARPGMGPPRGRPGRAVHLCLRRASRGAEDYAAVLGSWTRQVADGLTPAARVMFGLLCCLEEDDRIPPVVEGNWADLWRRLARPGDPPGPAVALAPLTSQGLAAAVTDTGGDLAGFLVHPGVAAAGRAQAGEEFQAAVDHEAAAYWTTGFAQGREEETGWLIVPAGRAAVPYLLRLGQRGLALTLLEQVIFRDESPGTIAALLPVLRQLADTAQGSDDEVRARLLVARALANIDPDASARQLRSLLTAVVERGDYHWASAISVYLIDNYRRAGRLTEAPSLPARRRNTPAGPPRPLDPAAERRSPAPDPRPARPRMRGPRRSHAAAAADRGTARAKRSA